MNHQPTVSINIQAPLHQISCILCRQRKVKCDKLQRCSNCVKTGVECVYQAPARPRRRIGNGKSPEDVSREELILRVRRYEALFRKHGLHFEALDQDGAGGENLTPKSQPTTAIVSHIRTEQDGESAGSRLPLR
jgi:hypothetical protein